jgi:AcrR family transcriptional regulator
VPASGNQEAVANTGLASDSLVERLTGPGERAYYWGRDIERQSLTRMDQGPDDLQSADRYVFPRGAMEMEAEARPAVTDTDRSRSLLSNATLVDLRRARILESAAQEIVERGFGHTSVKAIAARARVSTRTFYGHFAGLESCFAALLDAGPARVGPLILGALAAERRWQDGIRQAVASALLFFDRHPSLTRVWFIDSMTAGLWALQRCESHVALLSSLIVKELGRMGDAPEPWVAAGVMASILGLIRTQLLTKTSEPLITLLGPAMGLVTAVCLDSAGVEGEIERAGRLALSLQTDRLAARPDGRSEDEGSSAALSAREEFSVDSIAKCSRRVCECLLLLGDRAGLSNRAVARRLGIRHPSQVSRLLGRLLNQGLVVRESHGVGKANEWRLSPRGETLRREIVSHGIAVNREQPLGLDGGPSGP